MIRTSRLIPTTTEHKWVNKEEGVVCNFDFLSPKKLDSMDLCKSSCEKNSKCQSITFFPNNKWCSHFGTPCAGKQKKIGAISWTLIRNAGLPTKQTPCILALGMFLAEHTSIKHS